MRRIVALFMFVVVAMFVAGVGISSQVQAKGEPPIPGTTIKESPPFIEGTLILLRDGTATFVGDCVKPFDTKFFNQSIGFNIDAAVVSGDIIADHNLEGTRVTLSVPAGCTKDNPNSPMPISVIIKSVKNFTPEPANGSRTSIVARVVVARFIIQ